MPKDRLPTVAEYLEKAIKLSGKTHKQLAEEIGYSNTNIITMLKQGQTKVPVKRVPAFAKALGVDPQHLLDVVMSEYYPEAWSMIKAAMLKSPVTADELTILNRV